jgi:hypothetical protein
MTAKLSNTYRGNKSPAEFHIFFSNPEQDEILAIVEARTCSDPLTQPPPCGVNLFFGVFFDGTNNNLDRDIETKSQSNVARLYLTYAGKGVGSKNNSAWPNEEDNKNHFKVYIPGVGTQFDEVKDDSNPKNTSWLMFNNRNKGLAMSYKGEARIIWALVQVINNVARYYSGKPLVDDQTFIDKFLPLSLYRYKNFSSHDDTAFSPRKNFDNAFENLLKQLKQHQGL